MAGLPTNRATNQHINQGKTTMPLPDSNTVWPPKPYDEAQKAMKVWGAWYDGDLNALHNVYSNSMYVRPSQFSGGLVGRMARFFWGRPNPQGAKRVHVPAAADLARASSELLFSEPPTFKFPPELDDNGDEIEQPWREDAQKRLEEIFDDGFGATLAEGGELASAFGSVYLRLWWDSEIADHVLVSCHAADTVVPEFRYDKLVAATLWRVLDNPTSHDGLGVGNSVIRHLERHEKGRIYHGLYRGTDEKLGTPIPLSAHPETQWAADIADKNGMIKTGIDELTVVHIPNVKPNRTWRNRPGLAQLGRSDFDGLEGIFDALDEAMTSWMRDLDLGKARLLVEESMMKSLGPGRGAAWDTDQEIFTPLPAGVGSATDATPITQSQFDIRWQEHSQTTAEILNIILRSAGLSAAQFSDSSLTVGVPTATEVNSRNAMSERTRRKKIGYWQQALNELARAALKLDEVIFDTRITFETDPTAVFPVRSMQSPLETTQVLAQQRSADIVSIAQALRELHPNWSDSEIKEELERIKADQLEQMKLAYGQAGEQTAETPAEPTEGQPEQENTNDHTDTGEWDIDGLDDLDTADEGNETDDPQLQALAEKLAEEAT